MTGVQTCALPILETVAAGPASDRLVPAVNPTPAECRACGACCFSLSPTFVRVDGDDWAGLGPDAGRVAHFIGHRAYMRMSDSHCAALDVNRGPDGTADFFCTIYDRRPKVCRDLTRGSPECAGERTTKASHAGRAQGIGQAPRPVGE